MPQANKKQASNKKKEATPLKCNVAFGEQGTNINKKSGAASKFNVTVGSSCGGEIYIANGAKVTIFK